MIQMIKLIKHKTPFVFLGISIVFAFCSYFNYYNDIFKYLGDLFGYSLLTNLFMFTYYNNRVFCDTTRITVLGLMVLNLFNLIYLYFGVNGGMYDLIILTLIVLILIFLKIKKNGASDRRGYKFTK